MTEREALKLALEALDIVKRHYTQNRHVNEAITAIKEVLAQPEQEPVAGEPLPCPFCGRVGLDFEDGSTYRWGIASCGGCGASAGEVRREYPDQGNWHVDAIAEWNRRTTSPQLKPLTDEEIREICKEFVQYIKNGQDEYAAFVFAFDDYKAAHGIKGDT